MTDAPHAFENDVTIEQEVENGEVIYFAYADGKLIKRYRLCGPHNNAQSKGAWALEVDATVRSTA